MTAITVNNLQKVFRVPKKDNNTTKKRLKNFFVKRTEPFYAVKDVSFTIKKGEFVGYIGPNGAGKSTTIKMLTGIITPTGGDIEVLGFHPHNQRYEYVKHIGVVFGQRRLLQYDVAVMDSLKLFKAIYELSDADFNKRIKLYSKILGLDKYLHIPVRKLSLGERMRCEIAAALLHTPDIVFLDEPTIGLDQIAKEEIRDFLRYMNKKFNTTIILTTHDMDDIEELCERVIVIDKGTLIYDGKLATLKERVMTSKTIDVTHGRVLDKHKLAFLLGHPAIEVVKESPTNLVMRVLLAKMPIPTAVSRLFAAVEVDDLNIHEPRLEHIIKQIYESGI